MRVRRGLFRGAWRVASMIGAGLTGGEPARIGRRGVMPVVAEVARRASGFVLAIGADRPPAKLERDSDKQQVDESADHGEQYNIVARFALSCRP